MPEVARVNDKVDNLHGCDLESNLAGAVKSSKIKVNNQLVSLEGDVFTGHTRDAGPSCVTCPTVEFSAASSSKVLWEGKKCLSVGDMASIPKISDGSEDVVVVS